MHQLATNRPTNKQLAHLADLAALVVSVGVEGELALGTNEVHRLLGIGEGVFNADAVVLLDGLKQAVRLAVEAASVQAAAFGEQRHRGGCDQTGKLSAADHASLPMRHGHNHACMRALSIPKAYRISPLEYPPT